MKKIHDKNFAVDFARRKFLHELDRKKRNQSKRKSGFRFRQHHYFHPAFTHPLMYLLRRDFKGTNTAIFDKVEQRWIIQIPRIFSFIKNPNETIDIIYSIVEISKQNSINSILFDHSKLIDMDMGASAVLDIVALSLREEWEKRKVVYRLSGIFPDNEKLRQILMTMGITKQLNVKGAEPSEIAKKYIVQFPLYKGYRQVRSEIGGPQHRDNAVSKLVKYLDECLFVASNYGLSEEGIRNITKWAGEIITNSEEHSGHNRWFTIGFMAPSLVKKEDVEEDKDRIIGECQLAIFGFGQSIYDSLSSIQTPQETRDEIQALVKKHTGFFNLFEKYSEKDLWTLYALQDGVSRFSPTPGGNTRGKGTVEMIEAFHHFKSLDNNCKTEMSLISGSTWIRFDDSYHLKEEQVLDGTRKIIAFNQLNSLDEKPDSKHVCSLTGNFPGTLLTFKIFIDNSYLEKKLKVEKKSE